MLKIFEKLVSKWRDLIGREIHVTAVQPPLNSSEALRKRFLIFSHEINVQYFVRFILNSDILQYL